MGKVNLIATAAFGLEAVVARELKALGLNDLTVENGRIAFTADCSAIARCNLWLRSADRVQLVMGEFTATSFDQLFEETKALPWEQWIGRDGNFPVVGKSIKSQLYSVPDCQAIVKKAIVERLKQKYGLEWFPETGARYTVQVALLKDRATLTIDASGEGLHKRGYRQQAGTAPLRETLAAALVQLSYWQPSRLLLDPMCGSGTIAIEAALIGDNIAPGLTRRFVSEDWPALDRKLWSDARSEASAAIRDEPLEIHGSDADGSMTAIARKNADNAGVGEKIHFQRRGLSQVSSSRKYGVLITNPPYGQRMEDSEGDVFPQLARLFTSLDTWSFYVLTDDSQAEKALGRRADRRRKLYNGRILCHYYQFAGPRPPSNKKGPEGR